jgi:predicted metal-binding protein
MAARNARCFDADLARRHSPQVKNAVMVTAFTTSKGMSGTYFFSRIKCLSSV